MGIKGGEDGGKLEGGIAELGVSSSGSLERLRPLRGCKPRFAADMFGASGELIRVSQEGAVKIGPAGYFQFGFAVHTTSIVYDGFVRRGVFSWCIIQYVDYD